MTENNCVRVNASTAGLRVLRRARARMYFRLLLGLLYVLSPYPIHAAAVFRPLGFFGGVESSATDVSADGSVVVGVCSFFPTPGGALNVFRWTADDSVVRATRLLDGVVPAVSGDGSLVVGAFLSGGVQAFRWPVDGELEGLGDLGGGVNSAASGVSSDGRVIVGYGTPSVPIDHAQAFRWTPQRGMIGLGHLPGGFGSGATDVSADGSVVVGGGTDADSRRQAFHWTAEGGMVSLGLLSEAAASAAIGISADGATIVGFNEFSSAPPGPANARIEAVRWRQSDGVVRLGDLQGGRVRSTANDVSADGSVIVGAGESSFDGTIGTSDAFYWTQTTGMLNLRELLVSAGATGLDGWRLTDASGVSNDGQTVVGSGIDPNGQTQAFVATIPEPSTIALAASGAAGFLGFYLRARQRSRSGKRNERQG